MKVKLLKITEEADKLIEEAGRICWKSEDRITPDSSDGFIRMLIEAGHFSVLEHASASFMISGVSRALSHQLVRHRLLSFSQESQRYVGQENFTYVIPQAVKANQEALLIFKEKMQALSEGYSTLIEMGIKKEDARYLLPNATETSLVMTANFRQLRHMLILRGSEGAQLEIRLLFIEILRLLKEKAPSSFSDFRTDAVKKVIVQEKGNNP